MSSQSLGDHEEVEYGFNFDEWIIDNDLKPVKQLLIHHKATTLSALKFNTAEFQYVLTDTQLLTKIHMLPKLTNAVHTISKIVVADDEQEVIDCIQQNLKALNQRQQEIETLRVEHPTSITRINESKLKQMKVAKDKVNAIFNEISSEFDRILKDRRQAILSQIDAIEDNVHAQQSDIKDHGSKDIDTISVCSESISNCNQFLKQQQKTYNALTSTNEKRLERKANILKVGQMVTYQCTKTENILKDNIDVIKREIAANNALVINFDFVVKDNTRSKLIECVGKLGVIKNQTYNSDQERMNDEDIESEDHDASPPPQKAIPRSYLSGKKTIPDLEPDEPRVLRKSAFCICYECNAKFPDEVAKKLHQTNGCHGFPVDFDELDIEHNDETSTNHNNSETSATNSGTKNKPKRRKYQKPNTKEWEAQRDKAWAANKDNNPNQYYSRYPAKGQPLINGDWSAHEHSLFISRMKEFGVTQWGVFSMTIPGRIGASCS
eukprot:511822_1